MRQAEIPLFGVMETGMVLLDDRLIMHCQNEHDAFRLCLDASKVHRTMSEWAALLGKNKSTITQYCNRNQKRVRHIPPEVWQKAQRISGNWAVDQYLAFADGRRFEPVVWEYEKEEDIRAVS